MNTWKANLEETKKHYINWWNHKGIVLNMWEHFQEGVMPHADIPAPTAPKDLNQKWFDPQWRADYLDWYFYLPGFCPADDGRPILRHVCLYCLWIAAVAAVCYHLQPA